jgi:hypothetical protein
MHHEQEQLRSGGEGKDGGKGSEEALVINMELDL